MLHESNTDSEVVSISREDCIELLTNWSENAPTRNDALECRVQTALGDRG